MLMAGVDVGFGFTKASDGESSTLFKSIVGDIIGQLRNVKLKPNSKKIYSHGQIEYETFIERTKYGIPVSYKTLSELRVLQKELKIDKSISSFL